MKTFRFIFGCLMVATMAAVMLGAHHQLAIFVISGICYAVINGEIKKDARVKKPFPKTFETDKL